MNNQDTNNQSIIIEDNDVAAETLTDLQVTNEQSSEINGGIYKLKDVLVSSYQGTASRNNHNETVSEDSEDDKAETQKLTDLTVDEDTEAQIKGGLPAVQKVREAAAR